MPPQKKKVPPPSRPSPALVEHSCIAPAEGRAPVAAAGVATDAASGFEEVAQPPEVVFKAPAAAFESPAAIYEQLGLLAGGFDADGGDDAAPVGRPTSQEDFVTVVVTPKLTFQLLKRAEWETVQDIAQSELRRGFLSRFPPALWLSSEKFSFRPALPPTHRLTEETKTLVFKIVSDDVPDERVMLGILRELEKSYEAIIRRAVTETRSEAMQEQLSLQEQAEEVRREQSKQIKELRKEVNRLREQMQPNQKRLFLVEQEKEQLQRDVQQTKEHMQRLEKQLADQAVAAKSEQQDMQAQINALRTLFEGSCSSNVVAAASAAPVAAPVAGPVVATVAASSTTANANSSVASRDVDRVRKTEVGTQTERGARSEELASLSQQNDVRDVSRRVDQLQQQFGALQGWLLQGSQLMNLGGAQMQSRNSEV